MQPEFAVDRLELGRLDQLAVRDLNRVQRPFELLLPELEESLQFGEFGKQVVVLPDIGLQQPVMVRAPVQDMRRRQPIAADLLPKILLDHARPPLPWIPNSNCQIANPSIASRKDEQSVYIQSVSSMARAVLTPWPGLL